MTTLAQTDVSQPIEEGLARVVEFVPKAFAFVAILLIGWIVARLLRRLVAGVLERIGFDRAAEHGGVKDALARTGYDASEILAKLVFYAVMLFTLQMAFGVFGPNPISALLFGIIAFLPKVFVAIVILVLAAAIATVVRDLIGATIGSLSYGTILANAAAAVIVAIGVFAALDQIEIAPTVVNGVFYALLGVVAGVTIVAVGGGGIQPMRQRWEQALARVEEESSRLRDEAESTTSQDVAQPVQQDADAVDGADDEDDTTAELPTIAPGGAQATTARGPSAPAASAAASGDQPSAASLREQLEDAGWPTLEGTGWPPSDDDGDRAG